MFIQYLDYDLSGNLSEVCGDRGVIIVDGRCSLQTARLIARENNAIRRPCYSGFIIYSGKLNRNNTVLHKEIF